MQDYVRARMAGTQGPPQPAPDPMQSYVLAQGALGSRVPADTMMDSPQFTQEPGVAPVAAPPSDKYQAEAARHAQMLSAIQQMQAVSAQINQLPPGSPNRAALTQQWSALRDQVGQLQQQFTTGPIGQWADRQMQEQNNTAPDVDAIQNAIQNRQAQPRQPLPPPAPGGVPYAPAPAPVIPQPPATAGLTS
jgi:hypothetical protein